MACALGRGGVSIDKKEGDGATPAGVFPVREVLYRADRLGEIETALPARPIAEDDGWCDDPGDPAYNRPVKIPYPASHEKLWREDRLYDIAVVLGYNDDPPVPGRGSAIFLHAASEDFSPTEGCGAVSFDDLFLLVREMPPGTRVCVLESAENPSVPR